MKIAILGFMFLGLTSQNALADIRCMAMDVEEGVKKELSMRGDLDEGFANLETSLKKFEISVYADNNTNTASVTIKDLKTQSSSTTGDIIVSRNVYSSLAANFIRNDGTGMKVFCKL